MNPIYQRGLTYCHQLRLKTAQFLSASSQQTINHQAPQKYLEQTSAFCTSSRLLDNIGHPYKFKVPSPYKNPGPRRHGFKHKLFDGGPLPRHDSPVANKKYQPRDAWSKKRALFGQNDYIDILGDGNIHPVDLIQAPIWLKGFRGNELQRLSRRLSFEGTKIEQLYPLQYHQMQKRIKYLYKKYNQKRGKGGIPLK